MHDSPDVQRALMARDILEGRDDMAAISIKLDRLTADVEILMQLLHSANAIGRLLTWLAGLTGAAAAVWAWFSPHIPHGPLK